MRGDEEPERSVHEAQEQYRGVFTRSHQQVDVLNAVNVRLPLGFGHDFLICLYFPSYFSTPLFGRLINQVRIL